MASGITSQSNDFRRLLQASAALAALVFAAGQADAGSTLLLAAGGGGGAGLCCGNPGQPGVVAQNGTNGLGAYGGAGGVGGLGGAGGTNSVGFNGGGGAGWSGAGGNGVGLGPYIFAEGSGNGGQSKPTFAGGAGGLYFPGPDNADGGFGGGGGDGFTPNAAGGAGGGGGGSFFLPGAFIAKGKDGFNGVNNGAGGYGKNGALEIYALGHAPNTFYFSGGVGSYVTRYAGLFLLAAVGAQGGSGQDAGDIGGYGALGYEVLYLPKGLDLGFLAGGAGHTGDFDNRWGAGGGGGSFIWAQAPEPSSWLMMDIGVLGVGYALRRRMRKAATAA
jgi:hypothetical protein